MKRKVLRFCANYTITPLQEFQTDLAEITGVDCCFLIVPNLDPLSILTDSEGDFYREADVNIIIINLDMISITLVDYLERLYEGICLYRRSSITTLFVSFTKFQKNIKEKEVVESFRTRLSSIEDVIVFNASQIEGTYPCADPFDDYTDPTALVPYSLGYYKALAVWHLRMSFAINNDYKVITVDCDNTLWAGVCGEAKVNELIIGPEHLALQRFLLKKKNEGFLICLCSNNNEADIWDVITNHKDMVIKKEDIAGYQINWLEKTEKLKKIALGFGFKMDTLIFIDDDLLEVERVKSTLSEVCVYHWLGSKGLEFTKHLWATDKLRVTAIDRERTAHYHLTRKRETLLSGSRDLASFIESLHLKIEIMPVSDANRVAQLTQRVTQFRFSNLRLNVNQVAKMAADPKNRVFEISVRDDLGDYGIVGAVFLTISPKEVEIVEFCLSCRALGRLVEKRVIEHVQKVAKELGFNEITTRVQLSNRNTPAVNFINALNADKSLERESIRCRISVYENCYSPAGINANPATVAYRSEENTSVLKCKFNEIAHFDWGKLFATETLSVNNSISELWDKLIKRPFKPELPLITQASSLELVYFCALLHKIFEIKIHLSDLFLCQNFDEIECLCRSSQKVRAIKSRCLEFDIFSTAVNMPLSYMQHQMQVSEKIYGKNSLYYLHRWDVSNHSVIDFSTSFEALIKLYGIALGRAELFVFEIIRLSQEQLSEFEESLYSCIDQPTFILCDLGSNRFSLFYRALHFYFDHYSLVFLINTAIKKFRKATQLSPLSLSEYCVLELDKFNCFNEENTQYFYKMLLNAQPFHFPTHRAQYNSSLRSLKSCQLPLESDTYKKLDDLRKVASCTIFEMLFSIVSISLANYHQDNAPYILGTPIGMHDLIGAALPPLAPLFSVMPVVCTYHSSLTLKDYVGAMRDQLRNVQARKYTRLDSLIECLKISRGEKHPLFSCLILFQDDSMYDDSIAYKFFQKSSEFDVLIYIIQHKKTFDLRVDYNIELFLEEQIYCLMMHIVNCVSYALEKGLELGLKQLLSQSARKCIGTIPPASGERSSQDLWSVLSQQIHDDNQATAFNSSEGSVTYAQLFKNIRQHVHFIEKNNGKAEFLAICCANRRIQIELILAAVKLRITFIPIATDNLLYILSNYPQIGRDLPLVVEGVVYAELRNLSRCFNLAAGVSAENTREAIPGGKVEKTVHENSSSAPPENPAVTSSKISAGTMDFAASHNELSFKKQLQPNNLAYIMFTSGSTGRAKAVVVSYKNLINCMEDFLKRLNIGAKTRFLAHTSPSFDISLLEWLLPLLGGGTVIISDASTNKNPLALEKFIAQMRPTHIQATPSQWQLLLDAGFRNAQDATIISGGESLTEKLAQRLLAVSGLVFNVYGPTETTIWSLVSKLDKKVKVSIGSPIQNTYCFVRNSFELPVLPGGIGELYIGGDGVSKGYWQDSQSTQAVFIKDIYDLISYKTGDYVRITSNGELEYLGRVDRQIKLGGIRIELSEIEAHVNDLPYIKESQIISLKSPGDHGNDVLHCFIIASHPVSEEAIFNALSKKLPAYYIPRYFHFLEKLPLTQNGKIDVGCLAHLAKKQTEPDPIQLLGTWLCEWCQKFLHKNNITLDDNFFVLGGDSLLALQLCSALSEKIGYEVRSHVIFQATCLKDIVRMTENNNGRGDIADATSPESKPKKIKVAVCGISVKAAQIRDKESFWYALENNICAIKKYSQEELDAFGVPSLAQKDLRYRPVFAQMEDIYLFDPESFKMSPREALLMDPQHRILLELCWRALEDAGIDPNSVQANTGIFASCQENGYLEKCFTQLGKVLSREKLVLEMASKPNYVAAKIAHKLNLTGPAIYMDTTCSTGLNLIIEACRAIESGQIEQALVAAASITLNEDIGYMYEEGHIFSKEGYCKPFCKDADGTIPASAAGVVFLKSYDQAVKDGNSIYAIIEGYANNNDGRLKSAFTAPSAEAHKECIQKALSFSRVSPSSVAYIETHGTATSLGDSIELEALAGHYGHEGILLGALKANIGHTNIASGLMGFIKIVLARAYNTLPPFINAKSVALDLLCKHGFKVNETQVAWLAERPFIAVSSLGLGGTNAHVIVGPALHHCHYPVQSKKFTTSSYRYDANEPILVTNRVNTEKASESSIIQIFEKLLNCSSVNGGDGFLDLGGDSFNALDLISELEQLYQVKLSIDDIYMDSTAQKLAALINDRKTKQAKQYRLLKLSIGATKGKPLILIHPGNGNVYHYKLLAQGLFEHFIVYAIDYPLGVEVFSTITEMAQEYIHLIEETVDLSQGYLLGGWSYGATVAFEMSRIMAIEMDGLQPDRIILLEGWPQFSPRLRDKYYFEALFRDFYQASLEDKDSLFWVHSLYLRMQLLVNYKPMNASPVDCTLVKSSRFPKEYIDVDDPVNHWSVYLSGKYEVIQVSSDHDSMMEEKYVEDVVNILKNLKGDADNV